MQFDRRELGVELVKDVDVMPIDPHESLPSSIQLTTVCFSCVHLCLNILSVDSVRLSVASCANGTNCIMPCKMC